MDITKAKNLKEFKTLFKKQYSKKSDYLQTVFMVSFYPMLLLVSKKNNSIVWIELELEKNRQNDIFKCEYQVQSDFVRVIDFLSEIKKTDRELFIDFCDKGIISISNFYKIPISNITTPSLQDIQKNYRFLSLSDSSESENIDLNEYKDYFRDLQKSQTAYYIIFGYEFIMISNGVTIDIIETNTTEHVNKLLVFYDMKQDLNKIDLQENKLQIDVESQFYDKELLFSISKKEFNLISKQAKTINNYSPCFCEIQNQIFITKNDYNYQFEYDLSDVVSSEIYLFFDLLQITPFTSQATKQKNIKFYQTKDFILLEIDNKNLMIQKITKTEIENKKIEGVA